MSDQSSTATMHGWWANSRSGSVAHFMVGDEHVRPACDRVVIHRDGYPWPDGPRCKRCVVALENGRSTTVEMICLEDDEDGEHVCYLPLGHDGEHVWTPFGNGSTPTGGQS